MATTTHVLLSVLILTICICVCSGMGFGQYYRGPQGRVDSTDLCDMDDCFFNGWCSKHICQEKRMKTCPGASSVSCGGMNYIAAKDPAWGIRPPFNVKVWWNCNCVCCSYCKSQNTASSRLSGLLGMFGKKKRK